MSDYPEGWYDDPKDEGRERYWTGEGWTDDTREKYLPGWYEDPKRFGAERYWDGSGWTGEQRFVTRLDVVLPAVSLRKKDRRLVVSGAHVSWGDESIRWDDVSGFDSVTRLNNGRAVLNQITFTSEGGRLVIELVPPRGDQGSVNAFETIVDQAYRVITPRILNDLFKRADAGEIIEYEKLSVSPQGFAKGGKDLVPWSEYAGWRTMNALLEISRKKGDKNKVAVRLNTTHLGRWILTTLLDDYAGRYSKPPD
jgi:hypothetical protein